VVGDGERVAVLAIAKAELAFEIDAPEVVGGSAGGKRSTLGAAARAALVLNETVAVQHGVDGADRGDFDFAGQSTPSGGGTSIAERTMNRQGPPISIEKFNEELDQ
jgi:hypothetical protein